MKRRRAKKLCGADVELANLIIGLSATGTGTGFEASRALLREFSGIPAGSRPRETAPSPLGAAGGTGFEGNGRQAYSAPVEDLQEWGRKFLPQNGGSAYVDLSHLELCLPEVLSCFDHLAAWHAMLRLAREAQDAANARLPPGQHLKVLVNNSDGRGNSYGSHLNFLITEEAWLDLFRRKLHHLVHFATYLASSIIFTGAGKIGSEAGAPPAGYQLSQRADFCRMVVGEQTTYDRPLVNSRHEPLAGAGLARMHVIFFDSTLCHRPSLLKVGVTQIVLAMIEEEYGAADDLLLESPLDALATWSRDPELRATAPLTGGRRYRALDVQWALFDRASRFVATGRDGGMVPRIREIMALWEDTLNRLESDVASLVGRLDWALKRALLEKAREEEGLEWESQEMRYLDQIYHSLDRSEGLYWAVEAEGNLERLVSDADIERFVREPPEDTRAWTRAQLLRRVRPEAFDFIDWDRIRFRTPLAGGGVGERTLYFSDPLAFTRRQTEEAFRNPTLDQILDALSSPEEPAGQVSSGTEVRQRFKEESFNP